MVGGDDALRMADGGASACTPRRCTWALLAQWSWIFRSSPRRRQSGCRWQSACCHWWAAQLLTPPALQGGRAAGGPAMQRCAAALPALAASRPSMGNQQCRELHACFYSSLKSSVRTQQQHPPPNHELSPAGCAGCEESNRGGGRGRQSTHERVLRQLGAEAVQPETRRDGAARAAIAGVRLLIYPILS